jgi:hypothetical protein
MTEKHYWHLLGPEPEDEGTAEMEATPERCAAMRKTLETGGLTVRDVSAEEYRRIEKRVEEAE